MRKILILAAVLAGAGFLAAAQASEDSTATGKDSPRLTTQTDGLRKDGEHVGAPRDERTHESREQNREQRRDAREDEDQEDRD